MEILRYIGSFVCQQMTERTFEVAGRFLPLCARCTGIYGGFFMGCLYAVLIRQVRSKRLPPLAITVTCVFFMVVLILQSIGSHFTLWRDTNNMRLILGLLGGSSISILLLPALNSLLLTGPKEKRVTKPYASYVILLALLGLVYLFPFIDKVIVANIVAISSIMGLVILYLTINISLGALIINWKKRKHNLKSLLLLAGLVLILFIIEGSVLKRVH